MLRYESNGDSSNYKENVQPQVSMSGTNLSNQYHNELFYREEESTESHLLVKLT
jgi:hypothetical protein